MPEAWPKKTVDLDIPHSAADRAAKATERDVLLRDLLDCRVAKSEREHFAGMLIEELWHFASCPFDHCERCIQQEKLMMMVRDTIPSGRR